MFKGIETNIRTDGTVDMEPHELRWFEFVVASPHSVLRKTIDQTPRMVGAVSQPGVCILGIRRGGGSTSPGVAADWDQVFDGGREARGRRSRSTGPGIARTSTTSWPPARSTTGCIFALDSDAHANPRAQFRGYRDRAREARGNPQARIVNYWSEKKFLDWAQGAWDR